MDHLMRLQNVSKVGRDLVPLNDQFKRQLHFWLVMLMACSGRAAIPREEAALAPWAIDVYTDAAGGSLESPGRGVGAVIPQLQWWSFMPWARDVNAGKVLADGKKVSRKLSALELMGPLLVMAAGAREIRGMQLRFWVDNSGSCIIWRKGYSIQCKLASTIVKAVAGIAAALGCRVEVQKVSRCSSEGTEAADALSKAQFGRFRESCPSVEFPSAPARLPEALLRWAVKPVQDDDLDKHILKELAVTQLVLGYNC